MLLRDALEESGIQRVEQWWGALERTEREALIALWYDCADQHFGAARETDYEMELRVVGTVHNPGSDTYEGFWNHEFYNYLINHEELYPHIERYGPHICTAERSAKAAICNGLIPANFKCDAASESCPMRKCLARFNGNSIRLSVIFVPKKPPIRSRVEPME